MRTADLAERYASRTAVSSSCASSAPPRTRWPSSAKVRFTGPPISARTRASVLGSSEPEIEGPLRSSASRATAMFSRPIVTTVSTGAMPVSESLPLQASAASTTAAMRQA